jgi:hypothetical protein
MLTPTGRSEKRTPIEVAVVLSRLNKRTLTERAFTENLSPHGLRAARERKWWPGTRLLISLAGEAILRLVSVVYCQGLANKNFAVGLVLPVKLEQYGRKSP